MPVDEVAELLRRWREAGGAWSRGRVLLDAAQLAGRLTPEERRSVAAALADTGAPDLARQLESRTGQPVDAAHLQAFADGLLELEGARLDQVIAALDVADAHLTTPDPDTLPPPPPPGQRSAVSPEDEVLDERLRDLAALEHLGDEELQGIRLGEIELGSQELGSPELGGQELGRADVEEVDLAPGETDAGVRGLGQIALGEVALGVAPALTVTERPGAEPTATEPIKSEPDEVEPDEVEPDEVEPDEVEPDGTGTVGADGDSSTATLDVAPREPDEVALVPVTAAPDEIAPRAAADALAGLQHRLGTATTANARLTTLTSNAVRDLDAPGALLVLDQVPAGWQRRRAATRLFAAGALDGVDPSALLARFPDARDRRFVAADLLDASDLAPEDLAAELPPQVVRRLALRIAR